MNQECPAIVSTIIRIRELTRRIPLAKSTIYAKVKNGTFPSPIKLGDRAVGWDSVAVAQWLEARKLASQGGAA